MAVHDLSCPRRRDPERPQRVQDDRDVDHLLWKRAPHSGQVSESRGNLAHYLQPDPGQDSFESNRTRALRDLNPGQRTIQLVGQQHDVQRS